MRYNDRLVIKINYFYERELLVRREKETKVTELKVTERLPGRWL